ncbi:MAG TPA: DUF4012 domain-containing protein, partial [Dehalococcoidia bacterium]|nr:DUF4012 domain-containing protein [Dehalococcoidia bacterium]
MRPFRPWRWLLMAAALTLLLLGGLEGYRLFRTYQDLSQGKALLASALATLEGKGREGPEARVGGTSAEGPEARVGWVRMETDHRELALVRAEVQEAGSRLRRATDLLERDPALLLLARVPPLGRQLTGATALAHMGVEASAIGVEAIEAILTLDNMKQTQEEPLSERIVPFLKAVEPKMVAMQAGVERVERSRQGLARQGLWGPLAGALHDVDAPLARGRELLASYQRAARLAPQLLGYDRPRRYLVLAMDNTEILPAGGFILVFGFLSLDQGRLAGLSFTSVDSIYRPWRQAGGYIEPPRPLRDYLLRGWPLGLGEASWWPDFPTAARKAIDLYREESREQGPIDGVVGINFFTLERLLDVLGPVPIERYGVTLDSRNVTATILIVTHPDLLRPWETHRYDFVSFLAEAIIGRALRADPSRWAAMLTLLGELGAEKNLLLYSLEPEVREAVAELGWDAPVRGWDGDYLMMADANVRSTKLNLVVRFSADVEVRIDRYGNAHNTVALSYSNDYVDWATGQDPRLASLVIAGGDLPAYGNYLRLLVPARSRVGRVWEEGREGPEARAGGA